MTLKQLTQHWRRVARHLTASSDALWGLRHYLDAHRVDTNKDFANAQSEIYSAIVKLEKLIEPHLGKLYRQEIEK
jgi:hypothetical protein